MQSAANNLLQEKGAAAIKKGVHVYKSFSLSCNLSNNDKKLKPLPGTYTKIYFLVVFNLM